MSQFFYVHPDNPQARLISQAVAILRNGGVIIYPTDSGYALGCHIGDKTALERICQIRKLDKEHNFTLCVVIYRNCHCTHVLIIKLIVRLKTIPLVLLRSFLKGPKKCRAV